MTNKQEIALLEEIDRLNEKIEDLKDEVTRLEKENQVIKIRTREERNTCPIN